MDSPIKSKSTEATGISRSGRVRKKSSKLTDFESPDEIDTRFKRRTDRPQKVIIPKAMSEDSDSFLDEEMIDVKDEPIEVEEWGEEPDEEEEGEDEEEDDGVGGEEVGGEGGLAEYSDPLQVDEDSTDVSRETSNYTQAQSLYFSEKQGKKSIVMKGGQVVVRRKKAQRKDKGKSRFTAYMLWAREVRPGIIQANPNMDFSAVNKRLGELWALVPTTQKYNWKRRAKRLAAKGNQKGGLISTGRPSRPPPPARANLINKGGVKPTPRPDPNPLPTPPNTVSQGTGHHRHSGQKAKKDYACQKAQSLQTRGGPPSKPVDPTNAVVLPMLEGELEPLHNPWDNKQDDGSQKPEYKIMSSPAMCPSTSTQKLKAQPMTKKKLELNGKNEVIKLAIKRNHMLREMDQELHKERLQMIQEERKREAERNHLLKEMDKELHKERLLLLQEQKKREAELNQQLQEKQKQEAEIRMLEKQCWLHKVNNAKTNKD